MTSLRRPARLVLAGLAISSLAAASCSSSDGEEDLYDDGDPTTPVDDGTVVPPDDQGVGGGAPNENSDPDANVGDLPDVEGSDDNDLDAP